MGGISNATQAIWMASITSAVNFVCTFLGVYLVDKIGRRLLLLGSMIGNDIGHIDTVFINFLFCL